MSSEGRVVAKVLKNGLANVLTGASASILTMVVPFFLVRTLGHDEFVLWMLLYPLASYFNFIGLGFQTSLSRYVAAGQLNHFAAQQSQLLSTAFKSMSVVSLIALAVFGVVGAFLQSIFPSIRQDSLLVGQLALLCLCFANAIALPFSAFGAAFVGMQRNDLNAFSQFLARILVAFLVITFAFLTHDLRFVVCAYLAATLLVSIGQYLYFRRRSPFSAVSNQEQVTASQVDRGNGFLRYSLTLSVWSISSLLLLNAPISIVGAVEYSVVAEFSLASTLVAFLVGIYNALINPMTQSVASRYGDAQETGDLQKELHRFSLVCNVFLLAGASWLIVLAPWILKAWVGEELAGETVQYVFWLTVANVLRNLQSPFSVFVIAIGKQARVFWLPAIEAIIAVVASVILGRKFGVFAICISLVVAAIIGNCLAALVAVRETLGAGHDLAKYLMHTFIWPLLLACPLYVAAATSIVLRPPVFPLVILMGVASCFTVYWLRSKVLARAR